MSSAAFCCNLDSGYFQHQWTLNKQSTMCLVAAAVSDIVDLNNNVFTTRVTTSDSPVQGSADWVQLHWTLNEQMNSSLCSCAGAAPGVESPTASLYLLCSDYCRSLLVSQKKKQRPALTQASTQPSPNRLFTTFPLLDLKTNKKFDQQWIIVIIFYSLKY